LWMYYSTPCLTAYLSPFCLHGLSICWLHFTSIAYRLQNAKLILNSLFNDSFSALQSI
jgi:hypothetical protein